MSEDGHDIVLWTVCVGFSSIHLSANCLLIVSCICRALNVIFGVKFEKSHLLFLSAGAASDDGGERITICQQILAGLRGFGQVKSPRSCCSDVFLLAATLSGN